MTKTFNLGPNAEVIAFKWNFQASNNLFRRKNGITTSRTSSFVVRELSAN